MDEPADELQAAEWVRDGKLDPGFQFHNVNLWPLRITGTGASYRSAGNEYVWRDPSIYMNDRFLARCNGLSVIWEHPQGATLDSEEFADRAVGSIMLPYLKEAEEEVWGVARIYDAPTDAIMRTKQMSTSPCVDFTGNENKSIKLDDGSKLLVEGDPPLLDHLAICPQGVWDKGGPPAGVGTGDQAVADEKPEDKKPDAETKPDAKKPDAEGSGDIHSKLDAIMDCMGATTAKADALAARMDAWEAANKKPDAAPEDTKPEPEPEKKPDAKADAMTKADGESLKGKIADLEERMTERPDAEASEMAGEQAKADSVFMSHGGAAPRPLQGEKPPAYRLRLARALQPHSEAWKEVDLGLVAKDTAAFGVAQRQIYADATAAAHNPTTIPEGMLREIRQKVNGVEIVSFKGSWNDAFAPFRVKPRKYNGRIQQGAA